MATVSTSYDIFYGVRKTVSPGVSVALQWGVRQQVIKSGNTLIYAVRMITTQGKVVSLVYGVRQVVSKNEIITYGIRVPIASSLSFSLIYGVRKAVSTGDSLVFNVGVVGKTQVSKALQIIFHTLIKTSGGTGGAFSTAFSNAYDSGVGTVKPPVDLIITIPIEVASLPPQIVTTSF